MLDRVPYGFRRLATPGAIEEDGLVAIHPTVQTGEPRAYLGYRIGCHCITPGRWSG